MESENGIPIQLLGSSRETFGEEAEHRRLVRRQSNSGSNDMLPREILHDEVMEQDLRRPTR